MSLAIKLSPTELAYWYYLSTRYLAENAVQLAPAKAQKHADQLLEDLMAEDALTVAAGPVEGGEREFHWAALRAAGRRAAPDEWVQYHGGDAWDMVARRFARPSTKAA